RASRGRRWRRRSGVCAASRVSFGLWTTVGHRRAAGGRSGHAMRSSLCCAMNAPGGLWELRIAAHPDQGNRLAHSGQPSVSRSMSDALLLLPDFLLIVCGFLLCRHTPLNRGVWEAVERLVYYLLFPVLLFN